MGFPTYSTAHEEALAFLLDIMTCFNLFLVLRDTWYLHGPSILFLRSKFFYRVNEKTCIFRGEHRL